MERANRANRFEKQLGKTALITIDHNATAFDNENKYSIADEYENAAKQVASGMESHIYRGSEMEAFTKRLKVNVEHFLPEWHQRGIKKSNFWTLKATSMPAAILELGFFDNYSEACFLMSDKFQSKIVEAIIMTMCEFSNIEYLGNGIQG
jgi:N-acetylmuramoyl-L-alanine amidase